MPCMKVHSSRLVRKNGDVRFLRLVASTLVLLTLGPWIPLDEAARVIQSAECTARERQNGTQCFAELPKDEYAIPLGNTVDMRCIVANQHGKVQWRASKILLGYDRTIPGYPRYRIIGDAERGEHTLQIMDVQLSDAGEYECQVTPVPANNHPLLRRKSQLVVLVKPSIPRILYPDVPPPDNQLIISQPDPILRITVLCVTIGGSPPPAFTWLLNNKMIPSIQQTSNPRGRMKAGAWGHLSPTIKSEAEKGESALSMLKSGLRDGDQLTCSVSNAATRLHHDVQQHNLTTRVTIRIHTPPGPPRIISPESSHQFLEGDELRAVCVASPPGNPFGGLFWRWLLQPAQVNDPSIGRISGLGGKGGARLGDYSAVEAYLQGMQQPGIGRNGKTTTGPYHRGDLISEDVQRLHYTLNKEKDQLVNTLIIPRITRRYHAAKLICETGHPVGSAHQTSIIVYVKYAPDNVTIGVDDGTVRQELVNGRREFVVYGRAGEVKTLVCRTGPYYKQATIKWIAQSSDSGLTKAPRQLFGQTRTMRTPDGESWYQESRVDVRITEEDDRGYIDCRVWSEGNARVDARVRLDIIFPPSKPMITGYKSLRPIKMAHTTDLVCLTTGGNPPPELAWFRDKERLTSSDEVVVNEKQSSLKLRVVPQKDDNGAHYHCSARNTATGTGGVVSDSVVMNIIFPPQRVSVNFHGPSVVPNGQPLVIDCQADTSNPVASITWWHFRCGPAHAFEGVQGLATSTFGSRQSVPTKCKADQIEGTEEKPVPGASGGLQARSRLWLRPTWHYHMDFIECRTENLAYGPPVWHDRLQLNITFEPQFLGLQSGKEKVVREGQTINLDLGPYANPPVNTVSWFSNGQQLLPQPLNGVVQPGPYTSGPMGELLALHQIIRSHISNYTIVAKNAFGESSAVFMLNVTFPAGIAGSLEENKTQTSSDEAHLECQATANPAMAMQAFRWYRYEPPPGWPQDVNENAVQLSAPIPCNQSDVSPMRGDKVFVHCEDVDRTVLRSRLTVYGITKDDVGTYVCEVNNGLDKPARKRINLLYPFAPTVIRLPRYTKAAGEQGSAVTLTCLIRTEPTPKLGWLKEGKLIKTQEGPARSKYREQFDHIRPGLYKSTLTLNDLQKSDFGTYQCQAVNIKGEALLEVLLSGTSTPDLPLNLRLLNATTNSLRIAWTQGFDGGLTQTFQIRWKQFPSENMFRYADVAANDNHHAVEYLITGLQTGTEYMISVNSMNAKHGASAHTDFIHVRTKSYDQTAVSPLLPPLSSAGPSDDNAILIIIAACVFGFVVLVINLVVIMFLVKRRRQRRLLARQRKLGGQHLPDMTLANGFAMVQPGSVHATERQAYNMKPPTHDDVSSDVNYDCLCCPQSRRPRAESSYVKADPSFENFHRSNGHVPPLFASTAMGLGPDMRPQSHSVCTRPTEVMPGFNHVSTNHLTGTFPLSESYHSTTGVGLMDTDGGRGMASPVVIDPVHLRSGQMGLFSTQPHDPLMSEIKLDQQSQYNQYTPRQSMPQSRYVGRHNAGIAPRTHFARTYGANPPRCGQSCMHQSMLNLACPNQLRTSTTMPIGNQHYTSSTNHYQCPRMSFEGRGESQPFLSSMSPTEKQRYPPVSIGSPSLFFSTNRQALQSSRYTKHHSSTFQYPEMNHFSDGENGYDQDRYAAELRLVQYGGGLTAELMFGSRSNSRANSHSNLHCLTGGRPESAFNPKEDPHQRVVELLGPDGELVMTPSYNEHTQSFRRPVNCTSTFN